MMPIEIVPHDTVIAKDGRPFGSGQANRMRSVEWLYPSVLAGSFRTMLGKEISNGFDADTVDILKSIKVKGPLLRYNDELYFPAPKDIVMDESRRFYVKRPCVLAEGEGCDLPLSGLLPTMLLDSPEEDFKPIGGPAFWSGSNMVQWLSEPNGESFGLPRSFEPEDGFLESIEHEIRTHIKIDSTHGTVDPNEGLLFLSDGLVFPEGFSIAASVDFPKDLSFESVRSLHPLGGERRLSLWKSVDSPDLWKCPDKVRRVLEDNPEYIRMCLATPAIFERGWLPGWIDQTTLSGTIPGTSLDVELKGACVERWKPVSGWGLEAGKVGPKPIRRMVPAGSIYFFRVLKGDSQQLKECWLESVCDNEQDRRDGFGLALWGIWQG